MSHIFYLSHGGPGSGRYPLGSGGREKSTRGISGWIRQRKLKKQAAQEQSERNEQLRKAMVEQQRKNQLEADKERVLREGTAAEVLRYQGKISNQELQTAVTRLNLESQLQGYADREAKTALDKVDKIMKTVKTTTEWAKIGTDTYNTFAAIYNATPDGREHPLTLVGKGEKKKKENNENNND